MTKRTDRRCFLARGVLGAAVLGAAHTSIEENILQAAIEDGSAQPGTSKVKGPKTDIAPGSLARGNIGNVSISRLLIGGNLIGGWAHARDLMYASQLFKAYNTESKIFETLELAQACGVNTIQIDPSNWPEVSNYNKSRQTPIQTMVCIHVKPDMAEIKETVKHHIDLGATLLYIHGGSVDNFMRQGGSMDVIAQIVEAIKAQGVPGGVGGHSLDMPIECEKHGVPADFYVKTLHSDEYWSATPAEARKSYDFMEGGNNDHDANHDNMWCNNPEETIAFMESVKKPWFAFKVMAAGAIHPRRAFSFAYRGGADFVVAGMFDFQVETDVKIAIDAIGKNGDRKRPWCA